MLKHLQCSFILLSALLLSFTLATVPVQYTITGPSKNFVSIATVGTQYDNTNLVDVVSDPSGQSVLSSFFTNGGFLNQQSQISVARNGEIRLWDFSNTIALDNVTCICPTGKTYLSSARIAVLQCGNLASNGSSDSGVFVYFTSSSCIVSYENMLVDSSSNTINAQVEIFSNGNLEFRYGSGSIGSSICAIGFEDPEYLYYSNETTTFVPNTFGNCNPNTGLCTSFPANAGLLYGKETMKQTKTKTNKKKKKKKKAGW